MDNNREAIYKVWKHMVTSYNQARIRANMFRVIENMNDGRVIDGIVSRSEACALVEPIIELANVMGFNNWSLNEDSNIIINEPTTK